MKRLTKTGIAISTLWLLVFFFLVLRDADNARGMTLNEWGDFIAGASSLLALLWLVIGYFQHGEELRLNTKALQLQKKELRNHVDETARLAVNAQRQAKAAEHLAELTKDMQDREESRKARDAAPDFLGDGGSDGGSWVRTNIRNHGGAVRNIEFHYSGPYRSEFSSPRIWETDSSVTLFFATQPFSGSLDYPIQFRIVCSDTIGYRHDMQFELRESHDLRGVSHTRTSSGDL